MSATYKYYLNNDILLFYYNEIKKPGSLETDVDNFYNNFLRLYFRMEQNYGIEQESRPLKELGLTQRTDFTVRYIKNGSPKKVILLEDKRSGKETSSSEWRAALDQVVRYAMLVRTEAQQNPNETIYLTVNMGTYLRFYQLNPWESDAVDFGPAGGKIFELAVDEEEVHRHFTALRDLTLHQDGQSSSSQSVQTAPSLTWRVENDVPEYWDGAQWVAAQYNHEQGKWMYYYGNQWYFYG